MEVDRRRLVTHIGLLGLTRFWPTTGKLSGDTLDLPLLNRCRPLTRSLISRASKIRHGCEPLDKVTVERTIRRFAKTSGWSKSFVIKWMDTPADAYDYLSRFGLDVLLDMGLASFWHGIWPVAPSDEKTIERAFEVRMLANELLSVDQHDAVLMAPKLAARSDAISAKLSADEVFRVRAVSSQIGWLETSMADAAAQTVANVELLLSTGASEDSVAIGHQLQIFQSHERGLLTTWETSDAILCVPRRRI